MKGFFRTKEIEKVGQSDRSLGKHILLSNILGRETAIIKKYKPKFLSGEYTVLDLCSGSGDPNHFSGVSSPQIISRYASYLKRCNMFFFEKDHNTFLKLKENFPDNSYLMNSQTLNKLPIQVGKMSCVFIHADPNSIKDWPISGELFKNLPKNTTMLITLGCNVGGLKRLSIDKRKEWFDKIENVLNFIPNWHDATLAALSGDSAQWAYLLTGPKKWHDNGVYEKDIKRSFKYWESGVDIVQYKKNEKDFYGLINKLFLTKKEIENVG